MTKESFPIKTNIKEKAVKGTVTLTVRRILLRVIDWAGMIFLARALTQTEFGIFGIINFIVFTVFGFLSDVGLGASLIQKQEKVKKRDQATVFSLQFFLVVILNILVWLLSPYLVKWYDLSSSGVWLLRVTALCLVVTTFKTVPSVMLERELRYEKLLLPQVFEHISYNLVAVFLAWQGLGVWSLTIALLVRTVLGAIVLNLVQSWRISFQINRASLKDLLSFGVPYQLNSLLSLLKDNLTPTIIAFFYGPAAVGFVNIAKGIASKPMEVTNIVNRVVFPTFAKIQEDKERVASWLSKGIRLMSYLYFPLVLGLLVTARPILTLVYANKSGKWLPALSALYPFILGSLPVVVTTTATNVLFALGKSKIVLKLMLIYTAITWVVGIPLIWQIGYSGIAWAGLVVSFVSLYLVWRNLKKVNINFSLRQALQYPFLAALLMAGALYLPIRLWVNNLWQLVVSVLAGGLLYGGLLYALLGSKIKTEYQLFLQLVPDKIKNKLNL